MPGYTARPRFTYIPDDEVIDVIINNMIVTATTQIELRNRCNNFYYDPNIPYRTKTPVRPTDPAKNQYRHVLCNDVIPGIQATTAPTQLLDGQNQLVYNRQHDENWKCWGCEFAPANWVDMNKHFRTSQTCPLRGMGDCSQADIIANAVRVPRPRTG